MGGVGAGPEGPAGASAATAKEGSGAGGAVTNVKGGGITQAEARRPVQAFHPCQQLLEPDRRGGRASDERHR
eukprot:12868485-Alexandrium_andersonii.AAC.1